jgi:hypothetical protein
MPPQAWPENLWRQLASFDDLSADWADLYEGRRGEDEATNILRQAAECEECSAELEQKIYTGELGGSAIDLVITDKGDDAKYLIEAKLLRGVTTHPSEICFDVLKLATIPHKDNVHRLVWITPKAGEAMDLARQARILRHILMPISCSVAYFENSVVVWTTPGRDGENNIWRDGQHCE